MPKTDTLPSTLVAMCLAALVFVVTPATAEAGLSHDRLFAGIPGTVLVYGTTGYDISGYEAPTITPHEPDSYYTGDRIELQLTRYPSSSVPSRFAYRIDLPDPKPGISRVIVKIQDGEVLLDAALLVDSPVEVLASRTLLTENETLQVRARFNSTFGEFAEEVEVIGNRIRLEVGMGCSAFCPFPIPINSYELESVPLGPFPAGEYLLEVWTDNLDSITVLHQEKIVVVPELARLRGGRFSVEVPLDPPHGFPARLAALPSVDSALFYFFDRGNWELMVKVLDGCAINGYFWVFGAASTDVGHTVIVRDTSSPVRERQYRHPAGTPAPAIADIQAFACNPGDLP